MAKDHGFPISKMQRLLNREKKCKQFIKSQLEDEQKVRNFLKLSHPPNPKVPFIIDCLELRHTKEFGRGVYTTRDLKAGDIISMEQPLFAAMNASNICCNLCLTTNDFILIPCSKSASFMFCSEKCREKAYEKFPNIEVMMPDGCLGHSDNFYGKVVAEIDSAFKGRENLEQFINQNNYKKLNKTLFDYDFTDTEKSEKNYILSSLSLMAELAPTFRKSLGPQCSLMARKFAPTNKALRKFYDFVFHIYAKNNFIDTKHEAQIKSLRVFTSLINHSCWPNVVLFSLDGKAMVAVVKGIKAGEQLFFNYM